MPLRDWEAWELEPSCYWAAYATRDLPDQGPGGKRYSPHQGEISWKEGEDQASRSEAISSASPGKEQPKASNLLPASPGGLFSQEEERALSGPVLSYPLAFCDVETSRGGSFAKGSRICQIAITRIEPTGEVIERTELVNPGHPISWHCTQIHEITDAMVRNKRRFPALAPGVHRLLSGAVFIAHKAREIDQAFVEGELALAGYSWPCLATLCTLRLSERLWRKRVDVPSHKLGDLADHFQLPKGRAHRADGDVKTLMGLWWLILEKLGRDVSLDTLVRRAA